MQFHLVLCARFWFDLQDYLTMIGELERIPNKIYHDLPQPQWITNNDFGHLRVSTARQLDAFFIGARRKYTHCIFKCIAKIKTDQIQLQLTRLNFREIEEIVDQC